MKKIFVLAALIVTNAALCNSAESGDPVFNFAQAIHACKEQAQALHSREAGEVTQEEVQTAVCNCYAQVTADAAGVSLAPEELTKMAQRIAAGHNAKHQSDVYAGLVTTLLTKNARAKFAQELDACKEQSGKTRTVCQAETTMAFVKLFQSFQAKLPLSHNHLESQALQSVDGLFAPFSFFLQILLFFSFQALRLCRCPLSW